MNTNLVVTSGPALEKGGDLIGMLTHLETGDVLFIDEIHRTPKAVEELLYPAMEDFSIDFIFDKGNPCPKPPVSIETVHSGGATTRVGLLSAPPAGSVRLFRALIFTAWTILKKLSAGPRHY
ncbi:MAG: hypothetical protein R2861_07685 [Desulfobacterales bacterium]